MPRRRELKGITKDFAELLNSRNNDFQGYWATGQLYSFALNNSVSSIALNLSDFSNSLGCNEISLICKTMRASLDRIVAGYKIPLKWISIVTVKFNFDEKYQSQYHFWRSPLGGERYIIELKIESDLGNNGARSLILNFLKF
ncbi:MAG: hypothetical protein GY787_30585 [Alteromonadales bacterium]|nr:hypothetical protein [Alteromonadales bacterium]